MSARSPAIARGPALEVPAHAPRTLPEMLARTARRHATHDVTFVARDGRERALSYADLHRTAGRVAHGLERAGIRRGSFAMLTLDDERDLVTAFWGCVAAGVVAVPMPLATPDPPRAQAERIVHCWQRLGSPAVVCSLRTSGWAAPWEVSAVARPQATALAELDATSAALEVGTGSAPDDLALLLLTSGTSGDGKLVAHTHRSILAQCAATVQHNGFGPDDVALNWFPLDHVGGLAMFHLRDVFVGCRQVLASTARILRDPLAWLDAIERHRVTVTWAPNFAWTLVAERLATRSGPPRDLRSLRFLLNGGEPIVARQARRFLRLLAPHGLRSDVMHPAWGMSETCSGLTYSSRFSLERTSDDDPFVEVGTPLPGCAVRIVDDDERLLSEGEVGALEVLGPTLTRGYHGDPAGTAALFTTDGWLRTGDRALLRDGALVVTGRAKDVLIVGGVNHPASEVAAVVEGVAGVATESAIALALRLPDDATDRLAIVFTPDDTSPAAVADTTARIRAAVSATIGVVPRLVRALDRAAVPRGAIGKAQRAELAALLVAEAGGTHADASGSTGAAAPGPASAGDGDSLDARVRATIARALRVAPSELDPARPLDAQAPLDSLALVEILAALDLEFGMRFRGDRLPPSFTLDDLARLARETL